MRMDEAAGIAAWHSSRGDNRRSRRAVTIALPHRTYHWRKARMPDDSTPRSRRALLAAAAGGAAALAAQAALPLTAMAADPNDVVLGVANASTRDHVDRELDRTAATASPCSSDRHRHRRRRATSAGGAGSFRGHQRRPALVRTSSAETAYTGAYGWSPDVPDDTGFGAGVWGDSPDCRRLRQRRRRRLRLRAASA